MDTELAIASRTGASTRQAGAVRVQAPGRLHLGFLDPAATLGRRFGSLGLVIDGLETVVELEHARTDAFVAAPDAIAELTRARTHVETLRRATRCRTPLALHIRRALPAHAGLGSGTQLALAVGRAFCTLFDVAMTSSQIAGLTGRGQRSGVGIAGFDVGGLLLDGGPRSDGTPAALLSRIELPAAWRVLLVFDPRARGLSGAEEKAALATLPPLPRETSAEICHEVLMRLLPGAAGAEFAPFAIGLTRMQRLLGQHFAPAQQGRCFTSPAVARLIEWIASHAPSAVGQSSWGPTGFAILPSAQEAEVIVAAARLAGVVEAGLTLKVVAARNHGATITSLPGVDEGSG
ncbi:beta-ribofuranosylaminobenzene 5'-phosphate synthase family protein [Piscinibacter sp. XHJ-5]|uniref:beta-ribofuranosylaminobenzene 5'-phosphate synthase family protein n=1 Tax=Piscinibacter sp. XHJ-5 TaxID=3037797 RepID=UPI0024530AF2|nr:beta-ribofuranosylaminobenzene 5'-phosphate synthase family protein [Piscinibacter sp. XHJ-5]